ncbi:hypothetical protein OAM69_05880 [bacterium]|nr:hypothetical protein [bacterium]
MKSINSKDKIFSELKLALYELHALEDLVPEIELAFELAIEEAPLAVPYEFALVVTETLRGVEFYQTGSDLSKYALQISGPMYCRYLWRDTGDWVLSDEFYTPTKIAEDICKAPIFNEVPENVNELRKMLKRGSWSYEPEKLPNYGGATPADLGDVLSWDHNNILVGTELKNTEVVSRDEWKNIVSRESSWFK